MMNSELWSKKQWISSEVKVIDCKAKQKWMDIVRLRLESWEWIRVVRGSEENEERSER